MAILVLARVANTSVGCSPNCIYCIHLSCAAGVSGVQGNVWYVGSEDDLAQLLNGDAPHPPYVAFVDGRNVTTQAALTNRCVCVGGDMCGDVCEHVGITCVGVDRCCGSLSVSSTLPSSLLLL